MCGIAGFAGPGAEERVRRMCAAQACRGPNAEGVFYEEATGVCLGHRRLSIIDLSGAGAQPMQSADGRWVITYNGEIYNHTALRREVEQARPGVRWRGTSDTESLLEAVAVLGLGPTLARAVGMFAFCLYDRAEKTITLARDRAGEKPLYYGCTGEGFFFASNLAAVRAAGIEPPLDTTALQLYLTYGYYPAPHTVYKGVYKLQPGNTVTLRLPYAPPGQPRPYWNAAEAARRGAEHPFAGSPEEAVDELDRLLRQALQGQMVADVPLGAFLSGGVDSSTVVALMQQLAGRQVRTFSVGFGEPEFDEAGYAREVARHLGTSHTEETLGAGDALAVVPLLAGIYGEPFADSSQIPTYLVSRMAQKQVTVALSGDGGDELFCGYTHYPEGVATAQVAGGGLGRRAAGALMRLAAALPLAKPEVRDGWYVNGRALAAENAVQWYDAWREGWRRPPCLLAQMGEAPPKAAPGLVAPQLARTLMDCDFGRYLPDDILAKVDRAGMAVSLETRIPLLDHRVVEHAFSLPFELMVRNGQRKWPLRQVLYRYVPKELIERPKRGFSVPLQAWLQGPLQEWARDLLAPGSLRAQGLFDTRRVAQLWQALARGVPGAGPMLWTLLMFEAWAMDKPGKNL